MTTRMSKFMRDDVSPQDQQFLDKKRKEIYDELRVIVLRFKDLKRGDLITINFPASITDTQYLIAAEQAQILMEEYDCVVMILAAGISVSHLSNETMKQAGWIPDPDYQPDTSSIRKN